LVAGFDAAVEGSASLPFEGKRPRASAEVKLRPIFPAETQAMLREGVAVHRLPGPALRHSLFRPPRADRQSRPAIDGYKLTVETAPFLALWMCYETSSAWRSEDPPQPLRAHREEVQAGPGEPVHVTEFLKPGLEEFARSCRALLRAPLKCSPGSPGLAASSTSACT